VMPDSVSSVKKSNDSCEITVRGFRCYQIGSGCVGHYVAL
jgi:hypothetical protein